jgi:hypothetical protein
MITCLVKSTASLLVDDEVLDDDPSAISHDV